eukprot:g199.t1
MTPPALLPVAPKARLYLVTEPGFLGRFIAVVSTALLALWVASHFEAAVGLLDSVSHRLQFQLIIYANQSSQHSQLLGWFLLSMLSSSCCALQLFLGLFSFGCAGFNTVLGPLRPGFLAFTLLAQGWMWKTILDQPARASYQASALATGLSIALSFLPEALHYGFASGPLGRGAKGRNATVIVEFDVEGLGCIACSKTITRVLSGHDAVRNVKVTIETGIVAAELDTAANGTSAAGGQAAKTAADDTADIAKELAVLMDEAGFPAELLKLGGGPAIAPPTQDVRTIELTVDGMGCEACEAHVRGVLDRAGGVVSSQVNFEAGKATVMVAKDWGFALDSVSSELAVDGYDITDTVVVGDKDSSARNDDDDSQSSVVEAPRQQQPAKNEHKVKVEANGGGMGSRHSVMIDSAGSEL